MNAGEPEKATLIARGRPSLKERQFELRENMILDVANDLLNRKGFTFSTLDEVIAEVGISKPTFYQHFHSKEELFASVVVRSIAEATTAFAELERSLPPEDALKAMIDWTLDKRFDQRSPCCFDLPGVLSMMSQESLKRASVELLDSFVTIIEKAQNEGKARTGIPAVLLAQIILSVFKDIGYQEILDSGRIDLETFKTCIANLILTPCP